MEPTGKVEQDVLESEEQPVLASRLFAVLLSRDRATMRPWWCAAKG